MQSPEAHRHQQQSMGDFFFIHTKNKVFKGVRKDISKSMLNHKEL